LWVVVVSGVLTEEAVYKGLLVARMKALESSLVEELQLPVSTGCKPLAAGRLVLVKHMHKEQIIKAGLPRGMALAYGSY
jgi:hypothetical protein